MDRNLGAMSSTGEAIGTWGLYYQWGRSYPMNGGEQTGSFSFALNTMYDSSNTIVSITNETGDASAAFALSNPLKFIDNMNGWTGTMGNTSWINEDGTKGLFDPCPIGWRIVHLNSSKESPWKGASFRRITAGNYRGAYIGELWHPGCGVSNGSSIGSSGYGYYWMGNPSASAISGVRMYYMTSLTDNTSGTRKEGNPVRCVKE